MSLQARPGLALHQPTLTGLLTGDSRTFRLASRFPQLPWRRMHCNLLLLTHNLGTVLRVERRGRKPGATWTLPNWPRTSATPPHLSQLSQAP